MAKKKPRAKRKTTPAPRLESLRHKDKRTNIPTEELRDFVRDEEHAPKTLLYPRDPSLDPQLVWKGKDEQDRADLAIPAVPIYIQEKIHPQAIIDDLPRSAKDDDVQLNLYADFNGLPEEFDQRVDFYHHEGHWSNRMILGDSLLVMTSLAEKEGLKGKVQTIYLDPPYGIKFGSNWQVSTRKREVNDGKAADATRQPEQVRAFRDTWKLGIHSYLAYLRDRLAVVRDLLTDTGSVFVQIGDENIHLVRSVLDEVFGSENACSQISFAKTVGATSTLLPGTLDYLLWYCKDKEHVKYRALFRDKVAGAEGASGYTRLELSTGERRRMTEKERSGEATLPLGSRIMTTGDLTSARVREGRTGYFEIEIDGRKYLPAKREWSTHRVGVERLKLARRIEELGRRSLAYVRYLDDFCAIPITNLWQDTVGQNQFGGDKVYVVQTGLTVVRRCLLMTTDPGDLVLDPTCGSGTTAFVAEQWGRRWITCDTSRVALALARTRLMAAKFPYYYLSDDYPGAASIVADDEAKAYLRKAAPAHPTGGADLRKGFIYKRVPHVTLKSIANNPDIKEGMTRQQIDAAIARHAETEILYDQPYEDNKTVRVTGPFTVESLSPHRTISVQEQKALAKPDPTGIGSQMLAAGGFVNVIIDNLRKAGVQNTVRNERLKFDRLDIYPGHWIAAEGEYAEKDGKPRRVAVCIGPEHGTVGAELVKEAAKEAVQGVGFDVLIVCGFAFDPSVSEEAKRYGKLVVLPTRMNPDLAMGDELLKKTGSGNLFMVFGEPDVEITKQKDGRLVVEIKGLDVYDPTTGAIRSSSTDDIACWFIDTSYNGESFFVRHAYFTGAASEADGGPYDRLKRALRAEIDDAAWSSLYSTVSRSFAKPDTGKIAVKVINHYGDEVMKVFRVE